MIKLHLIFVIYLNNLMQYFFPKLLRLRDWKMSRIIVWILALKIFGPIVMMIFAITAWNKHQLISNTLCIHNYYRSEKSSILLILLVANTECIFYVHNFFKLFFLCHQWPYYIQLRLIVCIRLNTYLDCVCNMYNNRTNFHEQLIVQLLSMMSY